MENILLILSVPIGLAILTLGVKVVRKILGYSEGTDGNNDVGIVVTIIIGGLVLFFLVAVVNLLLG